MSGRQYLVGVTLALVWSGLAVLLLIPTPVLTTPGIHDDHGLLPLLILHRLSLPSVLPKVS